jgi:hypothetical protein
MSKNKPDDLLVWTNTNHQESDSNTQLGSKTSLFQRITQSRVWKILKTVAFVGAMTTPVLLATHTDENDLQARIFYKSYEDIVDRYIQKHPECEKIEWVVYSSGFFGYLGIGKLDSMAYESVPCVVRNQKNKIIDARWPQEDGSALSLRSILADNIIADPSMNQRQLDDYIDSILAMLVHTASSENLLSSDGIRMMRKFPDDVKDQVSDWWFWDKTSRSAFRVKSDTLDDYSLRVRKMLIEKLALFILPKASRGNAIQWNLSEQDNGKWENSEINPQPLYAMYGFNSPEEFVQAFENGSIKSNAEVGVAMSILIHQYIHEALHIRPEDREHSEELLNQIFAIPEKLNLQLWIQTVSESLESNQAKKRNLELDHQRLSDELALLKRKNKLLESDIYKLEHTPYKWKKKVGKIAQAEKKKKARDNNISRIDTLSQDIEKLFIRSIEIGGIMKDLYEKKWDLSDGLTEIHDGFYPLDVDNLKNNRNGVLTRVIHLFEYVENFDRRAAIYPTNVPRTLHNTPQQSALNMGLMNKHFDGELLDQAMLRVDGDIGKWTRELAQNLHIKILPFGEPYSFDDDESLKKQNEDIFCGWAKKMLSMRKIVQGSFLHEVDWNSQIHSKVLFEAMTLNMDSSYIVYRTLRNFLKNRESVKEGDVTMYEIIGQEFEQYVNGDFEPLLKRFQLFSDPKALKRHLSEKEIDILYSSMIPNIVVAQSFVLQKGATPFIYIPKDAFHNTQSTIARAFIKKYTAK